MNPVPDRLAYLDSQPAVVGLVAMNRQTRERMNRVAEAISHGDHHWLWQPERSRRGVL